MYGSQDKRAGNGKEGLILHQYFDTAGKDTRLSYLAQQKHPVIELEPPGQSHPDVATQREAHPGDGQKDHSYDDQGSPIVLGDGVHSFV